jgi:hypothetical protein
MDNDHAPPCIQCGSKTKFVMLLTPSSAVAGAEIYYCEKCRHHNWVDLERKRTGNRVGRSDKSKSR